MYSITSHACATSVVEDDDDIEELSRPSGDQGRFQGERVITWVHNPRQELMVAPPLLHANPSDFGVWLESRQDSPLSGILLLRCRTNTRGCDACVEAAQSECRAMSPGLECVACRASQRTFCLRLRELPCQQWDARRLQEYRLRRRWWVDEAGRSFHPNDLMPVALPPPTAPSIAGAVAMPIPVRPMATGTRQKDDTRVTVTGQVKGAINKLTGLMRGSGGPLASSPVKPPPSNRKLSESLLSDVKSQDVVPSSTGGSPLPTRLQDRLLSPLRPQPFTIYRDPSMLSSDGAQPFPVGPNVPRWQLQLQGRTPFDSLPRQRSQYDSFHRGVEERLGSTQVEPLPVLPLPAGQQTIPLRSPTSAARSSQQHRSLATTVTASSHDDGSLAHQQGGLHVTAGVARAGRSEGSIDHVGDVDDVLGLAARYSEPAQRCLTEMSELRSNVRELGNIMNEMNRSQQQPVPSAHQSVQSDSRNHSRDVSDPPAARAPTGSTAGAATDPSLDYAELRRRGEDILRQLNEMTHNQQPVASGGHPPRTPPPSYRTHGSASTIPEPRAERGYRHPHPGGEGLRDSGGPPGVRLVGPGSDGYYRHPATAPFPGPPSPRASVTRPVRVGGASCRAPGFGGGGDGDGGDPDDFEGRAVPPRRGGGFPPPPPPGGGGGSGDGGGGDGRGGRSLGGDRDASLHPHGDPSLSGALANLLLDRIRCLEQGRGAPEGPRVRQKPVQLPLPSKELNGEIKTISVYKWLKQVAKAVEDLGLDPSYTLYQLANEVKLPAQWREVFNGASDLESAFNHLRQRCPPLQSCIPELIGKLTGQVATDGTNEAVIERCGSHLSAIYDLTTLFPQRDLNREQLLACLASVGSTEQLQAQMVTTIRKFDQLHSLPLDHPQRLSYVEQLRRWLEEERSVRVDILASIKVGKVQADQVSTVTSFVTAPAAGKPLLSPKNKASRPKPGPAQPAKPGGEKAPLKPAKSEGDKVGVKTCGICKDPKARSHPPWLCSQLPALRQGKVAKPAALCLHCCSWVKAGTPHDGTCGVKKVKDKQGGVDKLITWKCTVHGEVHYLLCTKCGAGSPPKPIAKPIPNIGSLATPLRAASSGGGAFPKVVFMSEMLSLRSKTGETIPVVCYFDSMGGYSFLNQVPEGYNYGEPGAQSQLFNLSTLTGTEQYSLPLATVKVSRHGQWVPLDLMVTHLPEIPCAEVAKDLLVSCKITHVTPKQCEGVQVKMILGAQESHLFPTSVPVPKALLAAHPGLTCWRSKLSGRLLLSGSLSSSHQETTVSSFVSQLDPSGGGQGKKKRKQEKKGAGGKGAESGPPPAQQS